MTKRTYPFRAGQAFSALIFATACGLVGCGADDGTDPNMQPVGYTTPDGGSTIVVGGGDAGTTTPQPPASGTPDAGSTIKPLDAGTPVLTADTGVVTPTTDAGPAVVPEGGVSTDGGVGMARPDKGMGDGKDVVCIGDSWMNFDNTVGIQESLLKVSKRPFRTFGVPGTKLLDNVIPMQYTMAKSGGAVKTVIMTAGGNDVLQDPVLGPINILGPGCSDEIFNADCKKRIDDVAAGLQKLWAQMAMDGVEDVLIISYSNKTLGGDFKMVSAYSSSKIMPICDSVPAPLRCSTFDTDMIVPNFKDRGDTIHPDNPTYDLIGAGVWKLMQDKGMRR